MRTPTARADRPICPVSHAEPLAAAADAELATTRITATGSAYETLRPRLANSIKCPAARSFTAPGQDLSLIGISLAMKLQVGTLSVTRARAPCP